MPDSKSEIQHRMNKYTTRKNMDKSHKAEETIKHSAGEGKGGPEF